MPKNTKEQAQEYTFDMRNAAQGVLSVVAHDQQTSGQILHIVTEGPMAGFVFGLMYHKNNEVEVFSYSGHVVQAGSPAAELSSDFSIHILKIGDGSAKVEDFNVNKYGVVKNNCDGDCENCECK